MICDMAFLLRVLLSQVKEVIEEVSLSGTKKRRMSEPGFYQRLLTS